MKHQVLLLGSDELVRSLQLLASNEWEVAWAKDGEQAAENPEANATDLVMVVLVPRTAAGREALTRLAVAHPSLLPVADTKPLEKRGAPLAFDTTTPLNRHWGINE